jgi:protoporphyrinogen/coproporphyrinogen III oxidase
MGVQLIVAGGGASGLAAAFRLQQSGQRVRVLESSDRAGGPLASAHRDGQLTEIRMSR